MSLHSPQDNIPLETQTSGVPADADVEEDLERLSGDNPDDTAYIDSSAVDQLEGITTTDVYQGETTSTQEREEPAESYDMLLESDLREGETDDSMEAVEEGLTYVPPIDPPVSPDTDDPEGAEVATGFALTAEEDLEEIDGRGEAEDALTARIRRALHDDSLTKHLARRLRIAEDNGIVIVRGEVDDLTDSDSVLEVIGDVPGVVEVRDETTIRGM
jgi:hypothetical protein